MWIVRLALRRPYTFIVMALLIVMLGVASIRRTPTDIFPNIDIPVVSVVWTYAGLSTEEMERQITTFSEFSTSFAVSNIKKIESQTLNGVAVIKIYFQPDVDIASATAQVTGVAQTILRRMPPGTTPRFIVRYNAGSVPILQMSLSSDRHSEAELYDYGIYRMRQQLAVVQGTTFPLPYGGSSRQVSVDLDPQKLLAYGVAPQEVNAAINAQNLILPTGSAKIGEREYGVSLNSSPDAAELLNDVPLKRVNGRTIFIRDVATVHDGFAVQTQVVREDGRRGVLLTVLKNGNSSTLAIADQVRTMLPEIRRAMPEGMKLELISDQSRFVSASIHGVLAEGLIAATLTGLLILLFLGSWRSTLIVTISIPLSILVAIAALSALGQTLNIMTLGGLALAVGILVDDATVEIENIHRNLAMGKPLKRAILDGAEQIAVPAFVATTAISIVFLSVLFLEGAARYLFMGMAMAVGFSVMASYFLSRTVIPTLVMYLLKDEALAHQPGHEHLNQNPGFFRRIHLAFERRFEAFRDGYVRGLDWALHHRRTVFAAFGVAVAGAALLVPHVGRDFFPKVDAGQIRMHVTAPGGTRIEETEKRFTAVAAAVRELIPQHDRGTITDVIGVPDGINLAVTDSNILSPADGEMLIGLTEHRTRGTHEYVKVLRRELPGRFPDLAFHFESADIVSQILNFGVPAPIDVQIAGFDKKATHAERTTPVVANHTNIQPTFNVRADVQGTDLGSVASALERIVADERAAAAGHDDHRRGAGAEHDRRVPRPRHRHRVRGRARVPADGRELPELDRPVHHPDRAGWGGGGHRAGAVRDRHHVQRPEPDGRDHGGRRGDGQQHPDGHVRQRPAARARPPSRPPPPPATRLRPVLMTAMAMVAGMLPMSLGLGEGGEQNASAGP